MKPGYRHITQLDGRTIILQSELSTNPFTRATTGVDVVVAWLDKYPLYVLVHNIETPNRCNHAFYCMKKLIKFHNATKNCEPLYLTSRQSISELEILAKSEPVVIHL